MKRFFPKDWDHYRIMECVTEALKCATIERALGKGLYLVKGFSKIGIEIWACIDESGNVYSWFPRF